MNIVDRRRGPEHQRHCLGLTSCSCRSWCAIRKTHFRRLWCLLSSSVPIETDGVTRETNLENMAQKLDDAHCLLPTI